MKSRKSQEKRRSPPDTSSFYNELWEEVRAHKGLQSKMTNENRHYSIHFSQMPTHTTGSSLGWKWRGLELFLQRTYNITLHLEPSDHVLPETSVQNPSSDQMYLSKSDAECVTIAAQIMRIRQLEENESTLLGFLNSNILPWPLVHRNTKLRRIQEKPIMQASTLEEPPINVNIQSSDERSLSWNLTPDTLFLYNPISVLTLEDIEQLNELGLSRDIIALNGEFKSASGSALEARLKVVCAGVPILLQRIKIRKAAGGVDFSDLSHYCFSICAGDFEIWRLEHVNDKSHAWQESCGTLTPGDGVHKFINVWNCLIDYVVGPKQESLGADIRQSAIIRASVPTNSKADKASERRNWRKRLRPRVR